MGGKGFTTGCIAIGWMDDVTKRQKENMILSAQVGIKICIGHSAVVQPGVRYISEIKCSI